MRICTIGKNKIVCVCVCFFLKIFTRLCLSVVFLPYCFLNNRANCNQTLPSHTPIRTRVGTHQNLTLIRPLVIFPVIYITRKRGWSHIKRGEEEGGGVFASLLLQFHIYFWLDPISFFLFFFFLILQGAQTHVPTHTLHMSLTCLATARDMAGAY